MDQEDYILREIAKIGLLLRAIIGSLLNKKENLAISVENPFETTNELLLNGINLDLDKLLMLDEASSFDYICQFNGINTVNLELLADLIYQLGLHEHSEGKLLYFEKALQLYEFCSRADKTFSLDRENKINEIKNAKLA